MSTLLIAAISFSCFVIAYYTYGRFLARKVFQFQDSEPLPSVERRDNIDFVPTDRYVIFGHHFTTIAGTGPIVGPAIAMVWGWLPALLWIVFGAIFVGAVHDLTALVLSLRHRGETLGEVSGRVLSPSAKLLFLILLTFLLGIVVAVFGNVIAKTFENYPISVVPTVASIPIAMVLGFLMHRHRISIFYSSFVSLAILVALILFCSAYPQYAVRMPDLSATYPLLNPTILWTIAIFFYCYFASVLPVWLLLQPRDYINSLILYIVMGLILVGLAISGLMGTNSITESAPAVRIEEANQAGAPPIFPFLFITVACGAVSGFHALASSGTTSKQVARMKDVQFVGYGAMILEGILAVVVIICCTAGIGMGIPNTKSSAEATGVVVVDADAIPTESPAIPPAMGGEIAAVAAEAIPLETLRGRDAWNLRYNRPWKEMDLGEQVGIFIEGGANFMNTLGIPIRIGHGIVAILIACFAATTIDSALRLMRYVLDELISMLRSSSFQKTKDENGAKTPHIKKTNRFLTTGIGLTLAMLLAVCKANPTAPYGTGGLILWPLFGAGNQVVAGLTLLVGGVYILRRFPTHRIWSLCLLIPAAVMIVIPLWALSLNIFTASGFFARKQFLLAVIGVIIILLACWLAVEAIRAIRRR